MVLAKLKSRSLLFNRRADCTKFAYDANGRQVYVMDALLRRTTYGYDSTGQQTLRIDGRGLRTTYFYDAEGKTTGWKYQDQTRATQIYDAVGQRTKMQDWTGRYTFSFDAVGRTLLASDSFAKRITYGYDAVGQRVRMREPDGGRFTYWYDGVGQITRLLNPFQENTTFAYDVAGRRTMQKLANRVRASYSYDEADRLSTLANVRADSTYVSRYDYAYDNTMNKTQVIESNGDRVTWSYDTTYQLTRERRSGANAYDTAYTYDASQNRKLMIASGTRTTYIYDVTNQLKWLQDNTGRTSFSYDANGNQLLQLSPVLMRTTYVWDGENRLSQVKRSSTDRNTYTYKSDNLRVSKQESTALICCIIWDGTMCLGEADDTGNTEAYYSYESLILGNVFGQRRAGLSSYLHADITGSVTVITDSAGAPTDSNVYTSYGAIVSSSGSTQCEYRYAGLSGMQEDSRHSIYNHGMVWYYAAIGRSLLRTPNNILINSSYIMMEYSLLTVLQGLNALLVAWPAQCQSKYNNDIANCREAFEECMKKAYWSSEKQDCINKAKECVARAYHAYQMCLPKGSRDFAEYYIVMDNSQGTEPEDVTANICGGHVDIGARPYGCKERNEIRIIHVGAGGGIIRANLPVRPDQRIVRLRNACPEDPFRKMKFGPGAGKNCCEVTYKDIYDCINSQPTRGKREILANCQTDCDLTLKGCCLIGEWLSAVCVPE
ncbi:MAG: hypothetical protein U0796_00315 [Gemmatales bacterium]